MLSAQVSAQTVDTDGNTAAECFKFDSYTQLASLAESSGYKQNAWLEGIREVPRVFPMDVPARW